MGFFNSGNLFDSIQTDMKHTSGCSACGAYLHCKNSRLNGVVGTNDILLILPPPNKVEDLYGQCGVDEEYEWLRDQFNLVGISFDDCSRINLTGCYQSKLYAKTISMCYSRVENFIQRVKPRLVIAFGDKTLSSTVATVFSRDVGSVNTWKRYTIPYYKWWKRKPRWLKCSNTPRTCVP